jgi:hypothetical protein
MLIKRKLFASIRGWSRWRRRTKLSIELNTFESSSFSWSMMAHGVQIFSRKSFEIVIESGKKYSIEHRCSFFCVSLNWMTSGVYFSRFLLFFLSFVQKWFIFRENGNSFIRNNLNANSIGEDLGGEWELRTVSKRSDFRFGWLYRDGK